MNIQHFYDPDTGTLSYVASDGGVAVVIDPVLDYEPNSATISEKSAEAIAAYLRKNGLELAYALDTHAHADHLTALPYFKRHFGAKTVIGKDIPTVQKAFRGVFGLGDDFAVDGSQWDKLMGYDEPLVAGPMEIRAIPTGGHTPASVSYLVGDAVFVGDTLFQPDAGTARCDFPGGSAAELYDSIQRIYALPPETKVYTLHDYQPGGRDLAFMATVAEHKAHNIHLHEGTTKEEFVALRDQLEAGKPVPRLILPSVQVNIRAGELPPAEANGRSYLKLPINLFA